MNVIGDFVMVLCCECGVPFGMTQELHTARKKDRSLFWCSNGHPQHFIGESDAQKYRRLMIEEQDTRINADDAFRKKCPPAPKRKTRKK